MNLFLRETVGKIPERFRLHRRISFWRNLTPRFIVGLHLDVLLIQLNEIPPVSSDGEGAVLVHVPVKGNGALPSRGNRINGESRSGVDVAAHKNIRFAGLIGQLVGHGASVRAEFYVRIV